MVILIVAVLITVTIVVAATVFSEHMAQQAHDPRLAALARPETVAERRRLGNLARELAGPVASATDIECVYLMGLVQACDVDGAALAAAELGRTAANGTLSWSQLNHVVNTLITAGHYTEALAVASSVPAALRERAERERDHDLALVELNLAEADVNLGRAEAALARLDACAPALEATPFGASGLGMQRAFIFGTLGRGKEAWSAIAGASRQALGSAYAAEYHLSRAFALLALGELERAEREAVEALSVAVRPASTRNALFLQARIAAARGEETRAHRLCREAAEHRHRWQGGDGLLFWGDLLANWGAWRDARRAWALAIERDPESISAQHARERLAEKEDKATPAPD